MDDINKFLVLVEKENIVKPKHIKHEDNIELSWENEKECLSVLFEGNGKCTFLYYIKGESKGMIGLDDIPINNDIFSLSPFEFKKN